jgi:hypothetical protein
MGCTSSKQIIATPQKPSQKTLLSSESKSHTRHKTKCSSRAPQEKNKSHTTITLQQEPSSVVPVKVGEVTPPGDVLNSDSSHVRISEVDEIAGSASRSEELDISKADMKPEVHTESSWLFSRCCRPSVAADDYVIDPRAINPALDRLREKHTATGVIIEAYAGDYLGPNPKTGLSSKIKELEDSKFNKITFGLLHLGRGKTSLPQPQCQTENAILQNWPPQSYNIGSKFKQCEGQLNGDIIFNETVFISDGSLVDCGNWDAWAKQLKALQATKNIEFGWSFGGATEFCSDFWNLYVTNVDPSTGTIKPESVMYKNMKALRDNFGELITWIDLDCEEITYDCCIQTSHHGWDTGLRPSDTGAEVPDDWVSTCVTAFAKLCKELGFLVSICPFTEPSSWNPWKDAVKRGYVDRINLQCYAGGQSRTPSQYRELANSAPFPLAIVAGFGCTKDVPDRKSPDQVETRLKQWQNEGESMAGAFMWQYAGPKDDVEKGKMPSYADAIYNAFR